MSRSNRRRTCPVCFESLEYGGGAGRPRKYCSDACKQRAYRLRKANEDRYQAARTEAEAIWQAVADRFGGRHADMMRWYEGAGHKLPVCPGCGVTLPPLMVVTGGRPRKYCSDACKSRVYYHRNRLRILQQLRDRAAGHYLKPQQTVNRMTHAQQVRRREEGTAKPDEVIRLDDYLWEELQW